MTSSIWCTRCWMTITITWGWWSSTFTYSREEKYFFFNIKFFWENKIQTNNNSNNSIRNSKYKTLIIKCFTWISTTIIYINISNCKCTSNKCWIIVIDRLCYCTSSIIGTITTDMSPIKTPINIWCWRTTSNTLNS